MDQVLTNLVQDVPVPIIMAFVTVMLIPVVYYACIPLWLLDSWVERFQFWLGCMLYIFCGPFINIAVLLYACWYMDSFGWGKTRKVVAGDGPASSIFGAFSHEEKASDCEEKP